MFIFAMLLHPEVQAIARAEIDAVVGRDRLPGFEDRSSLPYVEAVLMEVLRWMPITPQGLRRCRILYN
jgi:cytochrome P450